MMQAPNRQKLSMLLEKTLKEKDKLQSVALKVSEFGIVQMTRKRSGRTLSQQLTTDCPTCCTNGVVKSTATLSYELLRNLKADLYAQTYNRKILVKVPPTLFHYLSTSTYTSLLALEKRFSLKIILERSKEFEGSDYKLQQAP
jgi:ribonuclease G